ncbi:Uncharacterised protein [Legionella pneumophila]|nr:Uncharacterised protein [Legionella pneumophila]CZI09678.1 Uncharacterised protein [Legionella pneumophila]CZI51143.1 Uncharacterised protein [Legionella pneumophila]CZK06958.1 Uncharacterised protein [Legionella pneumophila]CZK07428.1 Uncharacterised protein [Legionella pneumophila]
MPDNDFLPVKSTSVVSWGIRTIFSAFIRSSVASEWGKRIDSGFTFTWLKNR